MEALENHMLNRDGDDHRRLRRLVTKAFTPRMVEQLRPRIQTIADELLDIVETRGEMDLAAEYAFPLPITVIAELLGVPTADQERFRAWSDAIITPVLEPEALERFFEQMSEFVAYLQELFTERRAEPRDDLISALIRARDEGDALSEDELFGTVMLLIVAGHETTVGLIGNAVLNLLAHQEQLELVRTDPRCSPLPSRKSCASRAPSSGRSTAGRRRTSSWGQDDQARRAVIAVLNSADRDPERFPDPDRLDVTRSDNRHLAFGRGSHYCLGAPLARSGGRDRTRDALPAPPGAALGRTAGRARVARDAHVPARRGAARQLVARGSTTSVSASTARTSACSPASSPASQRACQISPRTRTCP